jgi:hypothetical protein
MEEMFATSLFVRTGCGNPYTRPSLISAGLELPFQFFTHPGRSPADRIPRGEETVCDGQRSILHPPTGRRRIAFSQTSG